MKKKNCMRGKIWNKNTKNAGSEMDDKEISAYIPMKVY